MGSNTEDLYERVGNAPTVASGLPLVILLTGFTDAGSAVAGLTQVVRDDLCAKAVAVFSNDALLDYRARRPVVSFDKDHLTDYVPPRLELSLAKDAIGQPFLVLSGYEPDFAWDAFSAAVLQLAHRFEVANVTWVHAIAMPVPHTRPMGSTVSGNREDLVSIHSVWQPHTQVPATAGHLLEYRFVERGTPTAGFVLLVPHYLAETEYPATMSTALDKISAATGLVFDTDSIAADNEEYIGRVNEQVVENDDLQRMISGLEERYDSYMAGHAPDGSPLLDGSPLPSADELAAELERYLASRTTRDEDKGS